MIGGKRPLGSRPDGSVVHRLRLAQGVEAGNGKVAPGASGAVGGGFRAAKGGGPEKWLTAADGVWEKPEKRRRAFGARFRRSAFGRLL